VLFHSNYLFIVFFHYVKFSILKKKEREDFKLLVTIFQDSITALLFIIHTLTHTTPFTKKREGKQAPIVIQLRPVGGLAKPPSSAPLGLWGSQFQVQVLADGLSLY